MEHHQEEVTVTGIILKSMGNRCIVMDAHERCYTALIKGSFRIKGIRSTNPVVVGDKVTLSYLKSKESAVLSGEEMALITSISERKNYIIRKSINLSKESHILAANIDLALLLVTLVPPVTSTTFIDRYLATAEAYNVPVWIVFNKRDLYEGELLDELMRLSELYEKIGYRTLFVSATTGMGVEELRCELSGSVVLLSGHSGVGKSSLINMLCPHQHQATASLSDAHDTGVHTTTTSSMIPLGNSMNDGFIIDSPGIKGFGTLEMSMNDTSHYFREFFALSPHCRYRNCTHTHEPGCAVLQALANGEIAESRYNSYLSILNDEENGRYRPPQ